MGKHKNKRENSHFYEKLLQKFKDVFLKNKYFKVISCCTKRYWPLLMLKNTPCAHTHAYVHTHARTHIHTCVLMNTWMCVHPHPLASISKCTHAYTRAHYHTNNKVTIKIWKVVPQLQKHKIKAKKNIKKIQIVFHHIIPDYCYWKCALQKKESSNKNFTRHDYQSANRRRMEANKSNNTPLPNSSIYVS